MSNWHEQDCRTLSRNTALRLTNWLCRTIWCGEYEASHRRGKGPPAVDSLELFARQSCRETLRSPVQKWPIAAELSTPLPWSKCSRSPTPSFLDTGLQIPLWVPVWDGPAGAGPSETCSLLWVFPPPTVPYWVSSIQYIHSCLNEVISLGILCRLTALGITKSRTVILDLLLQGNSVLSQPSELFIRDQHWLKWLLLCQWYALCSPKMIVFGLFICTLWLAKTKLASFYDVDSNVVVRNERRVACLNKPRLLGTKTPVYSKVFPKKKKKGL